MSTFLITTEIAAFNYVIAVEDEHGFTPLYTAETADEAFALLHSLIVLPTYFTHRTEEILAAI